MRHVLVTTRGGIVDSVIFYDAQKEAVEALADFVKRMDVEQEDAAVFSPEGLVANAKQFLDRAEQFTPETLPNHSRKRSGAGKGTTRRMS